uniref:Gypsy-type retrotransposon protein n=2 Tax=Oryza sativa subsp. japonica TaxID=39947 RepID=A0A5S6RAP4_ORYSJ|nr:Putative Gypsy-type retrotransposon protein [Oryza sativa Japonica Group]AAM08730.1 Putative Gypsy-type retrotransposon protein [Oryza sativa Japonica Group]AAP51919.1 hypothetical protein LOC_Os10g03200 [Oryza sativa Japonica Group]
MDLEKSTSTTASLKKLQDDSALPGRGTIIFSHLCEAYIGVEPFLYLFRFYYELRWMEPNRGLSGYEVTADFVGRRIQPLQARAHLAFDYSGPEDTTRVSPRGLDSDTVGRRVSQAMISAPSAVGDIPVPLCDKDLAERTAAINALPLTDFIGPLVDHQAAALLKESVAKEASDAAATTTSGSNVPKRGRKFSSVLGTRWKATNSADLNASPLPQRRQRLVTIGEK